MSSKKIGIIVQARIGSTGLSGKVLKKLDNNVTVLDLLIKRLKLCKKVDEIILVTSTDKKNQAIIEKAESYNISWFVGDEENVLKRYYKAAEKYILNIIIRITSDCPFVDPKILDNMILFYKNNDYDYLRNVDETTNFTRGFEIEIFSFDVLKKIFTLAKTKPEKEHVTYFIYTHPKMFKMSSYNLKNLKKFENLRLTIDEKDDLAMCREIYKRLMEKGKSIDFSIFDIVEIVEENPDIMNINKNVQQKKI